MYKKIYLKIKGKGEITEIDAMSFEGYTSRDAFYAYVNKFFMAPAVRTIINLVIVKKDY